MREYTITYDDGRTKASGKFHAPDRLPQAGDVYEVTRSIFTFANVSYNPGDKLEVIRRTH